MLNPRTRYLFESEHLTAAHAAGIEYQLKKRKGRHYQPGLLVVALEGIQPGDPPAPVGFDGQNASRYAEWNR